MTILRLLLATFLLFGFTQEGSRSNAANPNSALELVGLWEAKLRFGPEIRGTLIVRQAANQWLAEIAGRTVTAKLEGDAISFVMPDGQSRFLGRFLSQRSKIVGHWIQPSTPELGPVASPVILARNGATWLGMVTPMDSAMTFYLLVRERQDGLVGAFLKNPERNVGAYQYPVDHLEREGDSVKAFSAAKGDEKPRLLAQGKYDSELETLSMYFGNRGGSFDFRRVATSDTSDFYPRGRAGEPYIYAPPPAQDDGWPTAAVEDVGISRAGLEKFVRMIIDTPMDSVHAPEVHGVLIARHGKLVFEEYFHGEGREKAHDTRSASKSLTATLIGAAITSGVPLKVSSPVYEVMNDGKFPAGLDQRKRALTLEHLLTMSSGLDCDDSDPNSPGREDYVTDESPEPDYYKYILALKNIRDPGAKAVYCSINPHLAGGVLKHAAGRSLPDLMQELLAQPMQMKRYYLGITPTGDAYMGGGARFLPRDFMKLAQLHLNGGTWNGRRILTEDWVRRSTSPLYKISESSQDRYGYLWWIHDYPYKGRTVRAYYASGNGWQHAIAIPELDLVIGFYAGNYLDRLPLHQDYIPNWILPAVSEEGPAKRRK